MKEYRKKLEPLSYEDQLNNFPEGVIPNTKTVYERYLNILAQVLIEH